MPTRLIALFAFFFLLPCWADPLYKIVDPDGKVTYTDKPPTSGTAQTLANVSGKAADPEESPVKAALMLYTKQIIVETSYRFCRDQVPESAPEVKVARDRWMENHASLLAKKIPVLHDRLTMNELRKIAAQSEQENERILRVMRKAPLSERTQWCNNAARTFASPEFNLAGNSALVAAIMNYKVRQ